MLYCTKDHLLTKLTDMPRMSRHSEALTFEKIVKTKSGVMSVKLKLELVWF